MIKKTAREYKVEKRNEKEETRWKNARDIAKDNI